MKEQQIIILSAFGRSHSSYEGIVSTAPESASVVVVPYTTYMVDQNKTAENIRRHLEQLGLVSGHIVGHSLGGVVAMDFASKYPDMVESLTLVDTAGLPSRRGRLAAHTILQSIKQFPLVKLQDNLRVIGRIASNPAVSWNAFSHAAKTSSEATAQNIHVPTLILWGEDDMATPIRIGRRLHQAIQGSKLLILPKLDHDWMLHKPAIFWKEYQSFLDSQK